MEPSWEDMVKPVERNHGEGSQMDFEVEEARNPTPALVPCCGGPLISLRDWPPLVGHVLQIHPQ